MNAMTNHRTRWTRAEDEFLQAEFDGCRETTSVIAELLGRSIDACQQRHYELTWGTAADSVEVKPEPGESRSSGIRPNLTRVALTFEVDPAAVCTGCFTVRAASGDCWC